MEEKSFILFKPNRFSSKDVYEHIIEELKRNQLVIENEYSIRLNSWQLSELWPVQCNDKLLFYAMKELYNGNTVIIEVYGCDAIKKVDKIKRATRTLYATGIIRNCIHAPVSLDEYNKHIKVIHNQQNYQKIMHNHLTYNCYRLLNDDVCRELAKYIIDIGLYTMIHSTIPYENSSNRYRYYLAEDEIHSYTDYVCFIYENFSEFDFQMACVLATILKSYGEVCLIDTDEEKSAELLLKSGELYNMKIKRHEIVEM